LFKPGTDDAELYQRFTELVRVRQVVGPPWTEASELLASRDLQLSAIVLARLEQIQGDLVYWAIRIQSVQDRGRSELMNRIRRHVLRDFGGSWPVDYPPMSVMLKRIWFDRCLLAYVLAVDRHRKELAMVFRPVGISDREGLIMLSMILALTKDQVDSEGGV